MKISLMTVSFNAEATIADAMQSVWDQVLPDGVELDYVVVDGLSKDRTVEKIRAFAEMVAKADRKDFSFRWVSEKDDGLYDAMNKGIRMAEGEVIGILNADDMVAAPDVIRAVTDRFSRRPEIEFLYSDVRFVPQKTQLKDLNEAPTRRYVCPALWRPWMLTFGYAPPHPGMYIRKSCFDKWGLYKHEYRIGADYEMTVRFTRRLGAKRQYMHKCAVAMRLGGESTKKGAVGSFVGNNYDVIKANRENGYCGSRWLILGKLVVKALELIVPRFCPRIGT